MVRVDLRTIVLDVPTQDLISRDNVSIHVSAVIYFRVLGACHHPSGAVRLAEPIQTIQVENHTPEPNGSQRAFWLRVPPAVTTAPQAVAWTFGLSAAEYDPGTQS